MYYIFLSEVPRAAMQQTWGRPKKKKKQQAKYTDAERRRSAESADNLCGYLTTMTTAKYLQQNCCFLTAVVMAADWIGLDWTTLGVTRL